MINHSETYISNDYLKSIEKVLFNRTLSQGTIFQEFKCLLKELLQAEFLELTSSGTHAFYRILMALDLPKDSVVLMPDYICSDLIGPIKLLGLKIELYDNQYCSWSSSVDNIIERFNPNVRVVLVNHVYGNAFEGVERLKTLLPDDVFIIEDSCHTINPNRIIGEFQTGNHSLCSFFSFNATKFMTTGEGGLILTNNHNFYNKLKEQNLGDRLSDFSCALGICQLKDLEFFIFKRNEIARRYLDCLGDYVPTKYIEGNNSFFRFPILVPDSSKFFTNRSIAFRKGVDHLISEKLKIPAQRNAKYVMDHTVSLPIYPSLKLSYQLEIIKTVKKLINES